MDPESLFRIFQVILGIGLVIFVHELGHFIAARLNGVRVDVFSIGMGPRIFSWVWGTTRFQLACIPIGGYVRMAGEDRRSDAQPPHPDDLAAKSVGVRFFVYSGGVLMNVVFGLVAFPIVFYAGVPLPRPLLDPVPGGQAWRAGLQDGTEVLQIADQEVFDFTHIATAIALGDSPEVRLRVRGADGLERTVNVRPHHDDDYGLRTIDANLAIDRDESGACLLEVEPDSAAWHAGVRSGDHLAGIVDGIPGLAPFEQYAMAVAPDQPLGLHLVGGPGGDRTVYVTPAAGPQSAPRLGLLPPRNEVAGVRDALDHRIALSAGDRLLSVNGRWIYRPGDLQLALLAGVLPEGAGSATLQFERDGAPRSVELSIDSREDALLLADAIALTVDIESTTLVVTPGESAALAGVSDGDRITAIDTPTGPTEVLRWEDVQSMIQEATRDGDAVTLHIQRPTGQGFERVVVAVHAKGPAVPRDGLAFVPAFHTYRADGVIDAIALGGVCSWRFTQETFLTVKRFLTRDVHLKNAGGIISIGAISYAFAETGWTKLLFFLCLLSINLAILNVLPIPLLDGGHLFFLIVEKIKGSPVSERIMVYSQMVGLVLILSLLVFITYNDVVRWFFPAQ